MSAIPVIAIFDVGKTNKKLFLFDENYHIVYEKTARFTETVDEDGDACENLESLRSSVFSSLNEVMALNKFAIKAVNFSAYGASLAYIDEHGEPLTPLYNYLKSYPKKLSDQLYSTYDGEEAFSLTTASPLLGSLNSGLQLFRLKKEQPEKFKQLKYALHLPQYLSFLVTGEACSDLTSIGCHTAMWNFKTNKYHEWISNENIEEKLAPIVRSDKSYPVTYHGLNLKAGVGLHDSSAALIPYMVSFKEPFILISTGTWCISLNPFNQTPLTVDELQKDCLCFLAYQGKPVKASRLFAGHEHEKQCKRIATHFNEDARKFRQMNFDPAIIAYLERNHTQIDYAGDFKKESAFANRNLADFNNDIEAYHQLMLDLVKLQFASTQLILNNSPVKRIFVDGGFSNNSIYMNLLAAVFPAVEVYAASMAQATAMGAALVMHKEWNSKHIPNNLIGLKYYASQQASNT
jgi:sugar (pentulose or hexulose) kinase